MTISLASVSHGKMTVSGHFSSHALVWSKWLVVSFFTFGLSQSLSRNLVLNVGRGRHNFWYIYMIFTVFTKRIWQKVILLKKIEGGIYIRCKYCKNSRKLPISPFWSAWDLMTSVWLLQKGTARKFSKKKILSEKPKLAT